MSLSSTIRSGWRLFVAAILTCLPMICGGWSVETLTPSPEISFNNDCFSWDAAFVGDRRLLVSNSPETITSLRAPVLWHDEVVTDASTPFVRHRVFIWHVNGMSSTIKVGITIENMMTSHALTLYDCRGMAVVSSVGNALIGAGIPLAVQGLNIETAPRIPINDFIVASASSTKEPHLRGVIGWNVPSNRLIGAVVEFTVLKLAPQASMKYMVRVVVGKKDESFTGNSRLREGANGSGLAQAQIRSVVSGQYMNHSRGSWPSSIIALSNQAHPFVYSTIPRYAYISFSDAHDLIMRPSNSYDSSHAAEYGNAGNWGVTYRITVYVTVPESATEAKQIELRLIGLNTSPYDGVPALPYAGACRLVGEEATAVPILRWGSENNSTIPILVFNVLPGMTESKTFEIIHAGGACPPVGIRLIGI